MDEEFVDYWAFSPAQLIERLQTTAQGLSREQARERFARHGYNLLKARKKTQPLVLLLAQFKGPIIFILLLAAVFSLFLHDFADAVIILGIILISALLGFWQEWGAANAVEKLLAVVKIRTTVLRDHQEEVPAEEIVPGDVILLSAGTSIPGDCLIIDSNDLFVNEATLTGETYPMEKRPGVLPLETPLSQRTNTLLMGTHVVSGSAKAVVVYTGRATEFGKWPNG